MVKKVWDTPSPVTVHTSLDRHWSTAFISIEFEVQSNTLRITMHSHISLIGDFKSCIGLQFVEAAILKENQK